MKMSCNLIIDDIELITPNRIRAAGYMNYSGNSNNRVVFDIDSTGDICNQISGYFLDKVLKKKKTKKDLRKLFELDKHPYNFTQEKIDEALKDDKPIILHYKY